MARKKYIRSPAQKARERDYKRSAKGRAKEAERSRKRLARERTEEPEKYTERLRKNRERARKPENKVKAAERSKRDMADPVKRTQKQEYDRQRYQEGDRRHQTLDRLQREHYGISSAEKKQLLVLQGQHCAVCGTTDQGKRGWHTEHDHTTNEVRGITCSQCNLGIGHFEDSIERLARAIDYLKHGAARTAARLVMIRNRRCNCVLWPLCGH